MSGVTEMTWQGMIPGRGVSSWGVNVSSAVHELCDLGGKSCDFLGLQPLSSSPKALVHYYALEGTLGKGDLCLE